MKITRDIPEQLIAEENSLFLAIALSAGLLLGIGFGVRSLFQGSWGGGLFVIFIAVLVFGGLLLAMVERTQVILDRDAGLVTLRRRTLLGHEGVKLPLKQVKSAFVEEKVSRSKGSVTGTLVYRPMLVLDDGSGPEDHPMREVYISAKDSHRVVAATNAWLGVETGPSRRKGSG